MKKIPWIACKNEYEDSLIYFSNIKWYLQSFHVIYNHFWYNEQRVFTDLKMSRECRVTFPYTSFSFVKIHLTAQLNMDKSDSPTISADYLVLICVCIYEPYSAWHFLFVKSYETSGLHLCGLRFPQFKCFRTLISQSTLASIRTFAINKNGNTFYTAIKWTFLTVLEVWNVNIKYPY